MWGETNLLSLHVFGDSIGQAFFAFRLRFVLLFVYPVLVEIAQKGVYVVHGEVCNGSLIYLCSAFTETEYIQEEFSKIFLYPAYTDIVINWVY